VCHRTTIRFQKSKKSYYCVLRERVVELHESEKAQKKNKTPKQMLDLAICFNVNRKVLNVLIRQNGEARLGADEFHLSIGSQKGGETTRKVAQWAK
jgi:hypothetical protein